jgi:hypothetical protein
LGDDVQLRPAILAALLSLTLAACGRPDASGLYLSTADRQVTLIQLAQTRDGVVTGRLEDVSIGPDGIVNDQSTRLDGAASHHDLVFKSSGAGFGGLGASGSFTHGGIELSGKGFELKARRSTLEDYRSILTRLRSKAAAQRQGIVEAQARRAELAVQSAAIQDAPDKAARIDAATVQLRDAAAKLDAGVQGAPDFGQRSADNTARLAKMAQRAPGLSERDRNQAIASANQVIVGTNQIAVARSQYAIPLNQIVQQGSPLATEVQRFCGSAQAQALARPCAQATAAATDFQSAVVHGVTVFNGYKRAIQDDLSRQDQMVRKMGG